MDSILSVLQKAVTPTQASPAYREAAKGLDPYLEALSKAFTDRFLCGMNGAEADLHAVDLAESFSLGARTGARLVLELFPAGFPLHQLFEE